MNIWNAGCHLSLAYSYIATRLKNLTRLLTPTVHPLFALYT